MDSDKGAEVKQDLLGDKWMKNRWPDKDILYQSYRNLKNIMKRNQENSFQTEVAVVIEREYDTWRTFWESNQS